VQLRLSLEQAKAVDLAVSAEETTGRSELIRRVVDEWLQAKGYLKN
jgi:metal-responsive CopG/Arc/MetJ family transcriptional regulator